METIGTEYLAGRQADVQFANLSTGTLHYNECYAVLERRGFRAWFPVSPAFGDVPCRDYLRALGPGALGSVSFPLPVELPAGTYRYRFTSFSDQSERLLPVVERVTNGFTVIGVPSEN